MHSIDFSCNEESPFEQSFKVSKVCFEHFAGFEWSHKLMCYFFKVCLILLLPNFHQGDIESGSQSSYRCFSSHASSAIALKAI